MNPEIFEPTEGSGVFDPGVFQPGEVEPYDGAKPSEWKVWMSSAAVSATIAIAAVGTILAANPKAEGASTPTYQVEFSYVAAVPKLSAAQKLRAARVLERSVPRPHPDDDLDETDFV